MFVILVKRLARVHFFIEKIHCLISSYCHCFIATSKCSLQQTSWRILVFSNLISFHCHQYSILEIHIVQITLMIESIIQHGGLTTRLVDTCTKLNVLVCYSTFLYNIKFWQEIAHMTRDEHTCYMYKGNIHPVDKHNKHLGPVVQNPN